MPRNAQADHGFFTRKGGVSNGIYKSLNCGPGSDDDPACVAENRVCVAEEMGVEPDHLISMHQVHGNVCLYIDGPLDERPECDALVTDRPGLALGVLTADCGPVLFYGEKEGGEPVVAVAHAGWGGAFKGILESTVARMKDCGAQPHSIRASVGPCIGPASYEVSEEFIRRFMEQDPGNEKFFKDGQRDGHAYFDLPGYIAMRLAQAGVPHVSLLGLDTYADVEKFFSFRRSTHNNEPDYGRQISCVVIPRC